MTIFTSVLDALHAGYEVLGAIQGGYLLRLAGKDGMPLFGIVMLKPKPEPERSRVLTKGYAFEPNTAGRHRACLADFALSIDHGVPVVKVKGDIDVNNIAAFKAVVDCAAMTDSPAIVVALTMTEYVCRGGFRILSELQAQLESVGRCLCISCDPNCAPRRTMPLLAVPFPIFDNVEHAIAALLPVASMQQRI